MYSYEWDPSTGGFILNTTPLNFSKEPRPVYYKELDILGFDRYWSYEKDDSYPYMWAEMNDYYYKGRRIAKVQGGGLYSAPELIILEKRAPDADIEHLEFVDISSMVEKNRMVMESLVQDAIKDIYNTYLEYKNRVDLFYVAFSGGKDSIAVLDIVQRALPHNAFKVCFGNTDMEFETTIELATKVKNHCLNEGIQFYEAKSNIPAIESWKKFGPPARQNRWCCTVYKTAPVINMLKEISLKSHLRTVMITGVRADESQKRSTYEMFSYGKKLSGQYSFHPLLYWSSAEIWNYIYSQSLIINDAYKLGFSRVGCIMCPNSNQKHEYLKRCFFEERVDQFSKVIIDTRKNLAISNRAKFLEEGGWKTRLSGRELNFSEDERFTYEETEKYHIFTVTDLKPEWRIWYKTMGEIVGDLYEGGFLEYSGVPRKCKISYEDGRSKFYIENNGKTRNSVEFLFFFKAVLAKAQYCIQCLTCVAECPFGNIQMEKGNLKISDRCVRCHECLKILSGCLYYNSIRGSKDMKNLKGINRYLSLGVNSQWIIDYFDDQTSEPGNRKTDVMYIFLRDADIIDHRKLTAFGQFAINHGLDDSIWELMLCNLVYPSQEELTKSKSNEKTPNMPFAWYVKNIPFNVSYDRAHLAYDMVNDETKESTLEKARGEFWNGFKTILKTTPVFREIGFGSPEYEDKKESKMAAILRTPWDDPDPRVILYSLYKFAEKCNGYYQFTLSRLLNVDIESDGISPTEIFGIDRDTMEKLLQGMAFNYPEFIGVSFSIDLDNISLRSDKTSADVLELF